MKFPIYIAKRYLFAKKTHNAINVITLISVVGVMIGAMAMIIVLSVFNGLEKLILSLGNSFNPDIEITLSEGKTFALDAFPADELMHIPGVVAYSEIMEETALIMYREKQHLVKMRGVSESFIDITGIDTLMVDGAFILQEGDADFIILGQGVAVMLDANINDFLNPLSLYVPRRGRTLSMNPAQAFKVSSHYASGVFGIQADFDLAYILVPIRLARSLLDYEDALTAVAVQLDPAYNATQTQAQIQQLLGPGYQVKNRVQQQEFLYKIMKSEKWVIYLILSFILIIATFNIIGSLVMLVLEKRKDIRILHGLGASKKTIKMIFITEGIMISIGGAITGIALGALVCWLQIKYGLVAIQAEGTFIIDAYPVAMKAGDFLIVAGTVILIGLAASFLPLRNLSDLIDKPQSIT